MKRKNILLITSDQHRWDCIGCNNGTLKTPNLDALANEGVTFDRAYTVNPVCTPARVSILTGEYPSRHGCYSIGTSLPEGYPTIPGLLSGSHFTALIGKAHFQACMTEGAFESPPKIFDADYFHQWSGPYYGFEHVQLSIGHGHQPQSAGMHYGAWLQDNGIDPKLYFGNGEYTDFGPWDLPEEFHYSKWTADKTMEAIELAKGDGKDRPFFIWSSFQDPHNPCTVPSPWAEMYDPEEMPVFEKLDGEFDGKPPLYAGLNENWNYGESLRFKKDWHCINTLPDMDREKKKRIMAMYYGMISLMDHHIGRIIQSLKDKGLYEDTVIVFTTDHGDYMGNHGMWWKGLPAYEDIQRLPFIVRDPACKTPGKRSKSMQWLVDLGRSFLGLAGIEAPPGIQGVDQRESWTDADAECRDHCIVEFRPTEDRFMQKTFIHGRHKMVLYSKLEWNELYDLETDPEMLKNLWDCPEHAALRMEMMRRFIAAEMDKDGVLRERTSGA